MSGRALTSQTLDDEERRHGSMRASSGWKSQVGGAVRPWPSTRKPTTASLPRGGGKHVGPQGRFVWYELMTTDLAAAQAFYGQVVGWWPGRAGAATGARRQLHPDGRRPAGRPLRASGQPP